MIRARWANAWFVFDRRAQRSSVSRSSMLNVKLGMGRPLRVSSSFNY
jgi:hypothetical protein